MHLSTESLLSTLTRARLLAIGREFGVAVPSSLTKAEQIERLTASKQVRFGHLIGWMARDELRAACRAHAIDDAGRSRQVLAGRLMNAHGVKDSVPPLPSFWLGNTPRYAPQVGDIVQVRKRQWLAESVVAPQADGDATRVGLVCLDDDNQGKTCEVLWELELGARVDPPQTRGLGVVKKLDPPRHFAAYLHALKWNAVTATNAELFQSPFRAGIKLFDHQLTPLQKALSLPRANLFIADDVGLGKTIEAGLVLSELMLRQHVDFSLIVCPASVCLQWQAEMEKRFGLRFEIYNRAFIARRRQERGFGVNPWGTHARFIISYATLRRPEYRDPLLQHLGDRARKSLLILDEAHTAAPASATKYAVDSRITKVIRDVAPRFENRLFLSATPHNGHSNSFSALLEILDPQRFTRGVPVASAAELEPVMVRRLKVDLRALNYDLPERRVVQVDVPQPGEELPMEVTLSEKLAEYTELMQPKKGRSKLAFISLQKRLLSSVYAFDRTLALHADSVLAGRATTQLDLSGENAMPMRAADDEDEDEYGLDDELEEATLDAEVRSSSRSLASPEGRARTLLTEMQTLSAAARNQPDAKVRALLAWIQENQCAEVAISGARASGKAKEWTDRRVIVFTEYGDTKRYLVQLLRAAVSGTDQADDRILQFQGGMDDEAREEVQRKFNSPPGDDPVRILVATDAAREGINLQGHCADLFHFDVPWNPARMEQRNGRIDRTLQTEKIVRCHYFFYPARREDVVLKKLIDKVDIIQRELGSLGAVVLDQLGSAMESGIDTATGASLDAAQAAPSLATSAKSELESQRKDRDVLRKQIEDAGRILNASRKIIDFKPALLRDAIDVGLELAGAGRLEPIAPGADDDEKTRAYRVPTLSTSWQATLDHLRPARGRDEQLWDWRKKAPLPVVFRAPDEMNAARVHLHLQHPFVQRILSRFVAEGFSTFDLGRVTVVRNPNDSLVRVVAFGRLSLFGPSATRLHDQLVSVAAPWFAGGGATHLKPFTGKDDRKAIEQLEDLMAASPKLDGISEAVRTQLQGTASKDFDSLFAHIKSEADALAHDAAQALSARGTEEGEALRQILTRQKKKIVEVLEGAQMDLFGSAPAPANEKEQREQDKKHMQRRLLAIDEELKKEPALIEDLYRVVLHRLEPVGLVYLWPETRA